jgi:hypothetical protein
MKSGMILATIAALAMGGMGGFSGNYYVPDDRPATDAQRRMFSRPVKLNKKQKAKRRAIK